MLSFKKFEFWNRRLHYYLGLYFLFFLWLFAFTGLLLNHSWKFTDFWPTRKVSTADRAITPPAPADDLTQARDIMRQLGIEGEIEWTARRTNPDRLDFRVGRPGRNAEVKTDFRQAHVSIQDTRVNTWGVLRVLHTFTGVRSGDDRNRRDWALTTLWALSMDAVAFGICAMILTSLYMWWQLKAKRRFGVVALALGCIACGFFVFGLRWI